MICLVLYVSLFGFVSTPFALSWRSSVPLTFILEMCQSCLLPTLSTLTVAHPHSTLCLLLFPLLPLIFLSCLPLCELWADRLLQGSMEIARLAPRKRAALICFKVKWVQAAYRFIRLCRPSTGPTALSLSRLWEKRVGQLHAVYKATTSVERTYWNV